MDNPLLHPEVLAALNIDTLSDNDKVAFLSQHGDVIFTQSLERLERELDETLKDELYEFLGSDPEPVTLLTYLLARHDQFADIVRTVVADVQAD